MKTQDLNTADDATILTVGTFCRSLGSGASNRVSNNSYMNIDIANLVNGICGTASTTTTSSGLHYLCNTNTGNNVADFVVADNIPSRIRGIQALLFGDPVTTRYASNIFSQTGTSSARDFDNHGTHSITYFANPNDPAQVPTNIFNIVTNLTGQSLPPDFNCAIDDITIASAQEQEDTKQSYYEHDAAKIAAVGAYNTALSAGDTALAVQKSIEATHLNELAYQAAAGVLRYEVNDTATYVPDTAYVWLGRLQVFQLDLSNALMQQASGNTTAAEHIISGIENRYDLDDIDRQDLADLPELMSMLRTPDAEYHLQEPDLAILRRLSEREFGHIPTLARNILSNYEVVHVPKLYLPDYIPASTFATPQNTLPTLAATALRAYPSPANETVNFVWDKPETTEKVQLRVTDAFGRALGTWGFEANALTVSVANLPDGMYFYQVLCENCPTETGKLVIKH